MNVSCSLPLPIRKIINMSLCDLPGDSGDFFCSCSDSMSLQCLCLKMILRNVISKSVVIKKFNHKPFTGCCSLFKVYCTNDVIFICAKIGASVSVESFLTQLHVVYSTHVFLGYKVYEFSGLSESLIRPFVFLLHGHVNLEHRDRRGYHLDNIDEDDYQDYFRSLHNRCLLRFIRFSRGYVQERLVKRFRFPPSENYEVQALPIPERTYNHHYVCRYALKICSCTEPCSCLDYESITISVDTIKKYLSGELRSPYALHQYLQYYANFID